jgi:hypothetical protein
VLLLVMSTFRERRHARTFVIALTGAMVLSSL